MKIVNKGIKVRVYPNKKQRELFQQNFGCSRLVYNQILDKLNNLYTQYPRMYKLNIKLINTLLNQIKVEFSFLKEVESTSLQQASRDLLKSYQMFFKNPKSNFPKFHTRKNTRLSFRQTVTKNLVQGNHLKLRKYGLIRFGTSKEYINLLNSEDIKINNITISCDNSKYFAIINIEAPVNKFKLTGIKKGFDLNSNRNGFLVSNTGEKYQFDINHEIQMIKQLNKSLSTKKKGSRSFKYYTKRLNKWYCKIKNKLNDFAQKLSTSLVKECDTIVIENNWVNILKSLTKGEQNIRFPLSRFKDMIQYKFDWYKPEATGLVEVNPAYTSQICHVCGSINSVLTCDNREWVCVNCQSVLDRDINAAINILNRWDDGDCLSARS